MSVAQRNDDEAMMMMWTTMIQQHCQLPPELGGGDSCFLLLDSLVRLHPGCSTSLHGEPWATVSYIYLWNICNHIFHLRQPALTVYTKG